MPRPMLRHLRPIGLLIPLLLTGCGSDSPDSEDGDGDNEPLVMTQFDRDMLDAHNAARRNVTPAASPALEDLTWDEEATRTAKKYAAKCQFSHNPNRGNLGENLTAATSSAMSPQNVVQGWVDEAADYDYASNTCASGKQCGHYTQVVWRNTRALGCAMQACTENSPFGAQFPNWTLWVCNYAPPGNYVGQRPY
ncbi:CAP domain-containing protein [Myxococcus sp. Y35]|uniref:CAP domain-containing protein n=1 Tax=Pseudomyxococcus flavus TaxID=3115648 RepID=UPI003CFA7A9E